MQEHRNFTDLQQPFTCAGVYAETPAEAISVMKESEYKGADSFVITLMGDGTFGLREEYLNEDDLSKIFNCTQKPVMAIYYRWNFAGDTLDSSDEDRQDILRMAVRAGADAIDYVGDTYDPTSGPELFSDEAAEYSLKSEGQPQEVAPRDEEAYRRQKAEIEEFHEMGAEVQTSTHARVHLEPERALEIAQDFAELGADMVKLVSVDRDWEDLLDTFQACALMDRHLDADFIMMSHGEHGILGRYMAPFFGSMLCFTQTSYSANTKDAGGFYSQPLTENVAQIYNAIENVTPNKEPEDLTWM
ncbi:MAG: 3-dehydroquinate dehydratase [uncultured archaeon A07HR60]|nr:MAG: 3-dehydroquinate dehydratase [uncultured archaeon A07HR60]